jgi:ribose 5-phosphate isomerase A
VSAEAEKRNAALAAVDLVEAGMIVGLGSGSTASAFVEALAAKGLDIQAVSTSEATAALARARGMTVLDIDAAPRIDLTIDGADQVGPGLTLIKGGGAAQLREKLVWQSSARCVVIADASKVEGPFGRYPLPVEVVAFGHRATASRIDAALQRLGYEARAVLREAAGAPVKTDSGNLIYDLPLAEIADPAPLAERIKALTGVVEHGLFLGLAERALIGVDGGVETLWP